MSTLSLKVGDEVMIRTVEELHRIYPIRMPFGLVDEMLLLCGQKHRIQRISPQNSTENCDYCIGICGFSWPEGALMLKTAKGNEY